MCQAYEGERAWLARRDLKAAQAALQRLLDRSTAGDEPTHEEWATAIATVLVERDA